MFVVTQRFCYTESGRRILRKLNVLLEVISGHRSHSDLSISSETADQLRKRTKNILLMSKLFAIYSSTSFPAYFAYLLAKNVDLKDLGFIGLVNFVFYQQWLYRVMITVTACLTFFYLLCFALKSRISGLKKRFHIFSNTNFNIERNKSILSMLREYNSICRTTNIYNQYWKTYIFLIYLTYVPNTSILLLFTVFAQLSLLLKVVYLLTAIQFISVLTFIILSAANVSKALFGVHQKLMSLCFLNENVKLSIHLRIKIGYALIRFETLELGPGFTCGNMFIITKETYSKVRRTILHYNN